MREQKIVFFGTPEFALPTLDALRAAHKTPRLIVSQPAKPAGRGRAPKEPPVALWAQEHEVSLLQPQRVRDPSFLHELRQVAPDVAIVVAFGQIFPLELLTLPRHGCVNLHPSLLPKYRGPAPIQASLLAGDSKTGVTIMRMEEEVDSGPILLQREVEIGEHETCGELAPRLAELGATMMVEVIEVLEGGTVAERRQSEQGVSFAPMVKKLHAHIDWALEAREIFNRLRAFTPWPGLTARFRLRPVKVLWGTPIEWEEAPPGPSGTFVGLRQGRLVVLCGGGTIFGIERLQRSGKRSVGAGDFVNGERMRLGERFA